ncbi:paralemmin-3 isoform X1 [Ambystoma mexicanum]
MEETVEYTRRLQAITEKRKLQEEIDRKRRELEEERLKLQQLKRKSLRDRWLMEATSLPTQEPEPSSPLEQSQAYIHHLQEQLASLQSQMNHLESQASKSPGPSKNPLQSPEAALQRSTGSEKAAPSPLDTNLELNNKGSGFQVHGEALHQEDSEQVNGEMSNSASGDSSAKEEMELSLGSHLSRQENFTSLREREEHTQFPVAPTDLAGRHVNPSSEVMVGNGQWPQDKRDQETFLEPHMINAHNQTALKICQDGLVESHMAGGHSTASFNVKKSTGDADVKGASEDNERAHQLAQPPTDSGYVSLSKETRTLAAAQPNVGAIIRAERVMITEDGDEVLVNSLTSYIPKDVLNTVETPEQLRESQTMVTGRGHAVELEHARDRNLHNMVNDQLFQSADAEIPVTRLHEQAGSLQDSVLMYQGDIQGIRVEALPLTDRNVAIPGTMSTYLEKTATTLGQMPASSGHVTLVSQLITEPKGNLSEGHELLPSIHCEVAELHNTISAHLEELPSIQEQMACLKTSTQKPISILQKSIQGQIPSIHSSIQGHVPSLQESIQDQITTLHASIQEQVPSLQVSLQEQIQSLQTSIQEPISGLQTSTKEQIPRIQASIQEPIPFLKASMQEPFSILQTSIKEHLPTLQASTQEQIPNLQASIQEQIPNLQASIQEPISSLELSIQDKIPNLQASIEDHRKNVQASIQEPVESLEASIQEHIPNLEASIEVPISILQGTIQQKIANLHASIKDQTLRLQTSLHEPIESIQDQFPHIQASIKSQMPSLQASTQEPIHSLQASIQEQFPHLEASIQAEIPILQASLQEQLPNLQASIQEKLPNLQASIQEPLPNLQASIQEHLPNLQSSIQDHLPNLQASIQEQLPNLKASIQEQLPNLKASIQEQLPNLKASIQEQLPNLQASIKEQLPILQVSTQEQLSNLQASIQEQVPNLQASIQEQVPNLQASIQEQVPNLQASILGQLPTLQASIQEHLPNPQASIQEQLTNLQASIKGQIPNVIQENNIQKVDVDLGPTFTATQKAFENPSPERQPLLEEVNLSEIQAPAQQNNLQPITRPKAQLTKPLISQGQEGPAYTATTANTAQANLQRSTDTRSDAVGPDRPKQKTCQCCLLM